MSSVLIGVRVPEKKKYCYGKKPIPVQACAGKRALYFGHRGLNYDSEAISLTRK